MIKVTYEIGGRKVSIDQFGNELEKLALRQITEKIIKTLSSVCCPEHGKYPNVIVKGKTIDDLSFEIQGCCQNLIDFAMRKLK